MICYNCGTKLQPDESTCPACGKKQAIPESLLLGGKKGDRSSIVGLYNYSYASVYETVETYFSEEDEIQGMIQEIYIEAFRRIHEVPNAGEFRAFLSRIAQGKLANRTPLEKEASPGWLIIPETQTLRRILSGVSDYMQEQAHRTAEQALLNQYRTEAGQDNMDESDSTSAAWDAAASEMDDSPAALNATASEVDDSSTGQDARALGADSMKDTRSDALWQERIAGEFSAGGKENPSIDGNSSDFNEESMEEALRQVASSANRDWGSLGFDQSLQENEPEEPVRDSHIPLVLGIVLAVAAAAIVIILLIGAFRDNGSSESERSNNTASESQQQEDSESEVADTEIPTETESSAIVAGETETAAGTEDMTEEATETEASETEVDPSGNILMSDDVPLDETDAAVFGNEDLLRSEVGSVTFLDTMADMPEDAWDVSANGDGLVMAWAVYDDVNDLYDLYVAGEGGIYASEDSAYMFASYVSATSIAFNGCFYTQDAKDMSGMFYECASLESLDLSGFDTSAVTSMSYMFYDCVSLADVDVSSFDTSAVTAMSYMFTACESLAELSLSGFDFANVTDMEYMLAGCSSLEALDIDTMSVVNANTEGMYEGTSFE